MTATTLPQRLLPSRLPARLVVLLATLLLGWGLLVGLLFWRLTAENEHEALQRLSYGLAAHIVKHWPELGGGTPDDPAPRQELLRMLMTVNPGLQVYVFDAAGRVQNYIGEPGMVRQPQVDTGALRAFLAGAPLPQYGTDPMGGGVQRLFSVAMFAPGAGASAGYLYIVLDGPDRNAVAARLSPARIWRGVAWAAAAGLLVALRVGARAHAAAEPFGAQDGGLRVVGYRRACAGCGSGAAGAAGAAGRQRAPLLGRDVAARGRCARRFGALLGRQRRDLGADPQLSRHVAAAGPAAWPATTPGRR